MTPGLIVLNGFANGLMETEMERLKGQESQNMSIVQTTFHGATISMFDHLGFWFAVFCRSQSFFNLTTGLIVLNGFANGLMESEMERLTGQESKNTSMVQTSFHGATISMFDQMDFLFAVFCTCQLLRDAMN